MFKKTLTSLLVACALVFGMSAAQASTLADIEAGTYLLHSNGEPVCSAQAVTASGQTLLITADHCTDTLNAEYAIHFLHRDPEDISRKISEQVYYAEVIKRVPESDIAILRTLADAELPTVDMAIPVIAKRALSKGTKVLVAGYPHTATAPIQDLVFTEGMFTGLSKSWMPSVKSTMYRTTGSVHYGNSGGGLYAMVGGTWRLVGIASQTNPHRMWSDSLFAKIDDVVSAIKSLPATDK